MRAAHRVVSTNPAHNAARRGWGLGPRVAGWTRAGRCALSLAAGLAVASSIASGYYQWTFFAGRSAPFNPVPAKFDLNALPNNTVSFFISDQQPGPLMPGDSFTAVVSQLRAAADAWNQVPAASIRTAFGGISTIGTVPQAAPGIDVVFDDNLPPGLLAQTRPTVSDDLSPVAYGASFVKILRSRVQLRRDLTANGQFSYSDAFFLTAVHEFGHALGLQHTLTSGVMSTAVTRATTKAAPLSPDDMAGLAMLYPAPGFSASTGTITGTVVLNGSGVNLASVVAVSAGGVAISTLTNPDGTYRMGGVPPGSYYVYAHPLPPPLNGEAYPANIIPPVDAQKISFPAAAGFDTQFYPGTRDWTRAAQVNVNAGASTGGINFNMQSRPAAAIPYVLTIGYQGKLRVYSPPLAAGAELPIVFYAPGTTANGKLAPGLNVSVVGGAAQVVPGSLQYYPGTDGYAYFYVNTSQVTAATQVTLAVSLPNDLYVLPAAFSLVPGAPPSVSSVTGNGTTDAQGLSIVTVAGSNLGPTTRVMFDGAAATLLSANGDGSLTVSAPPANGNYTAAVEALSADGQTSLQSIDAAAPPTFTYTGPPNQGMFVSPANLLPGTDAVIQMDSASATFLNGKLAAGFGSSDITVKGVWAASTGRVLMNISVSPLAQPGPVQVTAASGLQLLGSNTAVQVQTANPRQLTLRAPVLNQATGLTGVPAGGGAIVSTSGLPPTIGSGWTLTVGGQNTGFLLGAGNQLYFQVPAGLAPGPAVVQLTSPNGDQIPGVVMQIDPPPPVIVGVVNGAGALIDSAHPVRQGDTVVLWVTGLTDASGAAAPLASVHVTIAETDQPISTLTPGREGGLMQLQFTLSPYVPYGPQQRLTVGVDTRVSAAFLLPIRP